MTQNRRGTTARKIIISSAGQVMSKSRNWETFLSDGDNKIESIQFIADDCKAENFPRQITFKES